jgi:uncharacterized protein (TIGR02145 family)
MNTANPDAAYHLKSTSSWNCGDNGDNSLGFNAIPSGHVRDNQVFFGLGCWAHYWSTTYNDGGECFYSVINWPLNGMGNSGSWSKNVAFAIRCLKD